MRYQSHLLLARRPLSGSCADSSCRISPGGLCFPLYFQSGLLRDAVGGHALRQLALIGQQQAAVLLPDLARHLCAADVRVVRQSNLPPLPAQRQTWLPHSKRAAIVVSRRAMSISIGPWVYSCNWADLRAHVNKNRWRRDL